MTSLGPVSDLPRALRLSAALALLAMAGCANHAAPPPQAAAKPKAAFVAAVRPVTATPPQGTDVRGAILAALGTPTAGGGGASPLAGGAVEVVVNEPDGRALSVLAPAGQTWRPGEKVKVQAGAQTTLQPASVQTVAAETPAGG
jgi:hypothetical protein